MLRLPSPREGTFLAAALVLVLVAAGLAFAAILASTTDLRDATFQAERLRSEYVAMAGFERGVALLLDARDSATLDDPFALLDGLDGVQVYEAEPLVMDGYTAGRYDVSFAVLPDPVEAGPPEFTSNPLTDGGGFTSQVTTVDAGDGTVRVEILLSSDASEATPALSHVTLGLPAGAREAAAATATSLGGYPVEVVDPDPRTGVSGVKFDETALGEGGVAEREVLTVRVPAGSAATITVATKAGPGSNSVVHALEAPAAERPWATRYRRFVEVASVGWRGDDPTPQAHRVRVTGVVAIALVPAHVFDYAYFLNNWGWFYGDTIVAGGNVRSNGQFDGGGYASTISGEPRFEASDGDLLLGPIDDDGDGDPTLDGGVYAAWAVVGCEDVRGLAGLPGHQYGFVPPLPMPNLSNLAIYEDLAGREGSSIRIGGATVCDGVCGDDEPANLYLEGTAARPIVIDGPVVVRGDVIVKGVVRGQGTIYAGRNVYVAGNLTYADPPATWRPASTDRATREAWRAANASKDALGLFAREHVVLGNYTNASWRSNVNAWLGNPMNESREDSGRDFIPGTRDGRDGVPGTQDDDALEGDGVWTVESYTPEHAAWGLIPAGRDVGDPIPGTGEDIDGDGANDPRTTLSMFSCAALAPANWVNLPPGVTSFGQVSTSDVSRFDACFYTNHHLGGLVTNRGGPIQFNGAVVSRNESIIYGATRLEMNHDDRLTAGGAEAFGLHLPLVWADVEVLGWRME